MSTINDYLNDIKKQYPDTKDVREQIEELRNDLHIKTEEYQSQGLSYEAAATKAISSVGDIRSLFDEISGNLKNGVFRPAK